MDPIRRVYRTCHVNVSDCSSIVGEKKPTHLGRSFIGFLFVNDGHEMFRVQNAREFAQRGVHRHLLTLAVRHLDTQRWTQKDENRESNQDSDGAHEKWRIM